MVKMKIGIMTFHQADNYGAVLQCLALQEYLSRMRQDDNISVINYTNRGIEQQNKLFSIKRPLKVCLVNLYLLIPNFFRKLKFKRFRRQYLELSHAYNFKNIKNSNSEYDCFITGSDQVWNLSCTGNDWNYFLKFVQPDKYRISYAASFGFVNELKHYEDILLELKKYVGVSIREDFDDERLCKYTKVIDPVMLFTKDEWDKLLDLKDSEKKYILVYTVMVPVNLMEIVKEYARKYRLPVIYINNWIRYKEFDRKRMISPIEFVTYIRNAEYVFTTSFHAVAFSIIYNKKFRVELTDGEKYNYRVAALLKRYGLEMCDINARQAIHFDWMKINRDVAQDENEARSFLSDTLNQI